MKLSLTTVCFFIYLAVNAQVLTLEQAVATALKNNYDILIAENNLQTAKNNNNIGTAGFLPTLYFNANSSIANNNTKQNFSSGLTVDKNNVKSSALTTGIYLNWTIFDGLKMFATKERLNDLEEYSQLSTKIRIENTVRQVIIAYFDVVKQKQLIKGLATTKEVSEERLNISEKKLSIGSGSNVEVLQAKIDANSQQAEIYNQQTILKANKASLNVLMAVDAEVDYDVSDSIPLQTVDVYENLKNQVLKNNPDLLAAQKNVDINNRIIQEVRSTYLPSLSLNSNYLFTRNENAAGFALLNQNLGFNAGINFSWTLFNGLTTRTQLKNVQLFALSSKYQSDLVKKQANLAVYSAYDRHLTNMKMLELEENTIKLAKENMDISLERFKIGLSNHLELKEAQRSFEDANVRLVNARYNTKLSETELLRLQGALVK